MTDRVFIAGMGVVSALGTTAAAHADIFVKNRKALGPLSLFAAPEQRCVPVGQVNGCFSGNGMPRTHQLAAQAAAEAMRNGANAPLDAIIVGTTTGGMLTSETAWDTAWQAEHFLHGHTIGSVARYLADIFDCSGPAIAVATACSAGLTAIKLGIDLIRAGQARRVLAGGADALCRLTYFGFQSLKLVDPLGARPFDQDRNGMTVAEGAAMLLLESAAVFNQKPMVEMLGAAISCDAFHPSAPHPEGLGALSAMHRAAEQANIQPDRIDYIGLHGTGTRQNDLAEARAVRAFIGAHRPAMGSVKGAMGHSLAAAGPIHAAIGAMAIMRKQAPGCPGLSVIDPDIALPLQSRPKTKKIDALMVNALGFGGNNAALIMGAARPSDSHFGPVARPLAGLRVIGAACVSNAGFTGQTVARFMAGQSSCGQLNDLMIARDLAPRRIRRLKRLPRLALALAQKAVSHGRQPPEAVFWGSAYGGLTETHDFLDALRTSRGQFASPADFVGAVHNSPAAQVAIDAQARGVNLSIGGDETTFEQLMFTATLMAPQIDGPALVIAADEYHPKLSPQIDPLTKNTPAEGGAALLLGPADSAVGHPWLAPVFYGKSGRIEALHERVKEVQQRHGPFGAVLYGGQGLDWPQLGLGDIPIIDYCRAIGSYGAASAVAAVMAMHLLGQGMIPAELNAGRPVSLNGRGILLLTVGSYMAATALWPGDFSIC